MAGELGRVVVIVPTYNEAGNIEAFLARVRGAVPDADVLVVDDNSPDGTGRLAEQRAAVDQRLHVLHRPAKAGLGQAYLATTRTITKAIAAPSGSAASARASVDTGSRPLHSATIVTAVGRLASATSKALMF